MNKLTNEEQNKELLKLVKEYPTLPLVFFTLNTIISKEILN